MTRQDCPYHSCDFGWVMFERCLLGTLIYRWFVSASVGSVGHPEVGLASIARRSGTAYELPEVMNSERWSGPDHSIFDLLYIMII